MRKVFPNAKTVVGSTWDRFVEQISPEEVATRPLSNQSCYMKPLELLVDRPGLSTAVPVAGGDAAAVLV